MALRIRRPPAISEKDDHRAREYFDTELENMLKRVGTTVSNVGSIASGSVATVTITVPLAKADAGQTVQIGLPSSLNSGLVAWGSVTSDGVVSIRLYNSTGGAIDPASGTYSARVMP